MKQYWLIGLVLLVLAVLGAMYLDPNSRLLGLLAHESFYEGRPTRSWRQGLRDTSQTVQQETAEKLKQGGAAAVPVLAELVRGDGSADWNAQDVRVRAASILQKL